MINDNDWRLTNQMNYLNEAELHYAPYKPYREGWEHDHCTFCSETFSESEEDLQFGYSTLDNYHWICENCFNDFKEQFNWKVV